jgi:hypothetical protein
VHLDRVLVGVVASGRGTAAINTPMKHGSVVGT